MNQEAPATSLAELALLAPKRRVGGGPRDPDAGNHGHGAHWIRTRKRHRIYARDGYACVWCARDLHDATGYERTLDHVIPREDGGSNHAKNLLTCCGTCNAARGRRSVLQYAIALRPLRPVADTLERVVLALATDLPP